MHHTKRRLFLLAAACAFAASAAHAATDRVSLAIFSFRPTNIEAMGHNGDVVYSIISALENQSAVEVMSRRVMEERLFQAGLAQSDKPEMVLKAGRVLGINFVLFGRVTQKGGQTHAEIDLLDVRTRQVVKHWAPVFGGRESIAQRIPGFTEELIQVLQDRIAGAGSGVERGASGASGGVTGFQAAGKGERVALNWTADPAVAVSGYRIYRSENAGGPFQLLGKTQRREYVDEEIKRGRNYYYQIGSVLEDGTEVKHFQTVEVLNAGEKLPYAPLIIASDGFVRRASITFVPSLQNQKEGLDIRGYEVMRRRDSEETWSKIQSVDAARKSSFSLSLEVTDPHLDDGETYHYAVVSVDDKNRKSPMSKPVVIRTVGRPRLSLGREGLLRQTVLQWQPLAAVDGYILYRRAGGGGWEAVGKISGAERSEHTDKKQLVDGITYEYRLSAFDKGGETGASNTVTARTKDLFPFPEGVAAQSGLVKSVMISWNPVGDPDVGGYVIYRGLSGTGLEPVARVKGRDTTAYLDKRVGFAELPDGMTYHYAVATFNLFGAEGPASPAVEGTTKPRPAAVAGLTAASDGQGVILVTWDRNAETDITAYILYRSVNDLYWSELGRLASNVTRYEDADLKIKASYRYRVVVEDRDGLMSDPVETDPVPGPLEPPPEKTGSS